ncbi:DUF202 domain-containing protein [Phycicoccus flavus]|uniref:DUF202 domain-containing protein n=1 Tax=Phycicoccus flavus TaxID=2502783 RepID=UPI000FEBFE25|nr:DUF202 domain-containing protein [Phycicoccus flavus]NHA69538.1 DUF202 domain-containing protein [Phycicoccus flavus]
MTELVVRDPGMPQERTVLAWRRTGLALLVGSLTIGRLTLDSLGPLVVVPTVMTAAMALYVVGDTLRQRRLAHQHPDDPRFAVLRDARLVVVTSVVIGVLSAGELAAAVVHML